MSNYIEIDQPLAAFGGAKAQEAWMRSLTEALRAQAAHHARTRWPKHFMRSSRGRYGYLPRSNAYMRYKAKRWGAQMDLVKTGKSRDHILGSQPLIVVRNSKEVVAVELKSRFAFRGGGGRAVNPASRQAISIAQMRKEISKIIPEESQEIASSVLSYVRNRYIRGIGKRKKRLQ